MDELNGATCSSSNPPSNTSVKSHRSESLTSHRFYETDTVDHKMRSFIEKTSASKPKDPSDKIRQSKHLPLWAWYIIAKCNGIPLSPGAKPILGTLLHMLTFAAALTYAISYAWFMYYDITSPKTPRDMANGTVSILLVMFWCAFGYYCKDLSSRLFLHSRFLKDIRMHTRTVFKLNGALLTFILGAIFTASNTMENITFFNDQYCQKIELEEVVCFILCISSILFSGLVLVWHSLVSFVFMSVCRTHTIGIRRFIREIEFDATMIERHLFINNKIFPGNQDDIWQESLWIAEEENENINRYNPSKGHSMSILKKDINPRATRSSEPNLHTQNRDGEISILFSPVDENVQHLNEAESLSEFEWNYFREDSGFIPVRRLLESGQDVSADSATTPHTMTNAELMHHFWKLSCRLRFSSCALQRWYASFVALVLLRCSTYLVFWLGHPVNTSDVLQFGTPLILLVVISTAIAEVNFEGQRALRCIYPTEQRIKPLQYMALNQLQMSVYGFGMTHGTIVTVVFAILVGFVSKIVITEITK